MCLAFPGKIKELKGMQAVVEYPMETRSVLLADIPVVVGDFVMVQMGIVVKKLTEKEAKIALKAWKNV